MTLTVKVGAKVGDPKAAAERGFGRIGSDAALAWQRCHSHLDSPLSLPPMPQNRFYNAFDTQEWGLARKTDYRSPFQIDRDRIIHAHAFRKLQSKTQVFLSGEYDFYRTRLTHSMEVAQIGRSICAFLLSRGDPLTDDFYIDPDLVEACSLAHDMGHPPFGHSGERTLQELMKRRGGFEGNAQTLHLLCETIYQNESGVKGMQPTRAQVVP